MATSFDPYYKWLGIPPKDQPPTHYRLLGLDAFEPDHEVIDAAANRLMAYLQDLATGDHAEVSQRLLNEVAAARLCLLDPASKHAYDEQLNAQIQVQRTANVTPHPTPPPPPPPVPPPPPPPDPDRPIPPPRSDSSSAPARTTTDDLPVAASARRLPAIHDSTANSPGRRPGGHRTTAARARTEPQSGQNAHVDQDPRSGKKAYAMAAAGALFFATAVALGLWLTSNSAETQATRHTIADNQLQADDQAPPASEASEASPTGLTEVIDQKRPNPKHPSLRLWLAADNGAWSDAEMTQPAVAGKAVSTWVDQSVRAFALAQSDPARQPQLIQTGILKPQVRFGSDDLLLAEKPLLENHQASGQTTFTVFLMLQIDSATNPKVEHTILAQRGPKGQLSHTVRIRGDRLIVGPWSAEAAEPVVLEPGRLHLVTWIRTEDKQLLFVDGTVRARDEAPPAIPSWQPTGWSLGQAGDASAAQDDAVFAVAEMLVYHVDFSVAGQQAIERYLQLKHGQAGAPAEKSTALAAEPPAPDRPTGPSKENPNQATTDPAASGQNKSATNGPTKPTTGAAGASDANAQKTANKPAAREPSSNQPPAEAAEKKPPEPLADLPQALELPRLDEPNPTRPVKFGPLGANDPSKIVIDLIGGKTVRGVLGHFELVEQKPPQAAEGPKPAWVVRMVDKRTSELVPVAKFWIQANHLSFRWLEKAADKKAADKKAEQLINCELDIRAWPGRRKIPLRKPLVVDPLSVGAPLKRDSFDLPVLPPRAQLRLKLLGLEGAVPHTGFQPDDLLECNRSTNIQLANQDPVEPMVIEAKFTRDMSDGLVIETALKIERGRIDSLFNADETKRERDKLESSLNTVEKYFENFAKQHAKDKAQINQQTKVFNEKKRRITTKLNPLNRYLSTAAELKKSGKLHFRVFAIVDGHDVTLVTSKPGAAE